MSNQVVPIRSAPAPVTFGDMERLAESIAKSGLFGMKNKDQALALMAIAQAEGRHPALAVRDYDIIQGRSAKKAEAMMRDFIEAGGKVDWHSLDDTKADATFSHPSGGTVRITWDMERVKAAGMAGKDMYKKYPRQMLRSRVVSEGVRTVCPAATSGMYVPEELGDFEARPAPAAALVAPAKPEAPHDPATGEIKPHQISIGYVTTDDGDKSDWRTWGMNMIAAVNSAQTREELSAWIDLNQAGLAGCAENGPKSYKSVDGAIQKRRAELAPAADARVVTEDAAETAPVGG